MFLAGADDCGELGGVETVQARGHFDAQQFFE